MTESSPLVVWPHDSWLSQGDIFESVLVTRVGVANGIAAQAPGRGPALLVSHGCAIDKKTRAGTSRLEYVSFLPIQDVDGLEPQQADQLRRMKDTPQPYEVMYLGELPGIGEGYLSLTQPFTLPAVMLRTELKDFTAEETGDEADRRIVPTIGDTRVAKLSEAGIDLFHHKWIAQWTRKAPK